MTSNGFACFQRHVKEYEVTVLVDDGELETSLQVRFIKQGKAARADVGSNWVAAMNLSNKFLWEQSTFGRSDLRIVIEILWEKGMVLAPKI